RGPVPPVPGHCDVVHPTPGILQAQLARDTGRAARAASHVAIAAGASPRRTAPPDPSQDRARSEPREDGGVLVPESPVAEPARQRVPDGPYACGRALERHPRRGFLVTGIVVRVARGQVLVAHARTLVEEAAAATADDRVEAGNVEGAVGRRPARPRI